MNCDKSFSKLPNAPNPSFEEVFDFLRINYNFPLNVNAEIGERNLIAFVMSEADIRYVVKIFSREEHAHRIDAEVRVMAYLHEKYPDIYPAVLPSATGDLAEFCVIGGEDHYGWVIEFREGISLAQTRDLPKELLWDIGDQIGRLDLMLTEVDPQPFRSTSNWAPHCAAERISTVLSDLPTDIQPLIEQVLDRYQQRVLPIVENLPKAVIHNDLNDGNILVKRRRVSAIIDFGDMLETYRICELANTLAYIMLDRKFPIGILSEITGAYCQHIQLSEQELEVLIDFILLRLALSLTLSYVQQEQDPDNLKLSVSRKPVRKLLERILANPDIIEACRRASIKHAP